MCTTKTGTWLFWQEKESLDYPFPPRESGHQRCKCWRHICFRLTEQQWRPHRCLPCSDTASVIGKLQLLDAESRARSLPFILVLEMWSWARNVLWLALFPSAATSSSEVSYQATSWLPEVLFLERAFGKWQNQNSLHEPLHIYHAVGVWSSRISSGGMGSFPHLEPRCTGSLLSPR